jgi:hypothetical protein
MAAFDLSHDLDDVHLAMLLKGVSRQHILKDSAFTTKGITAAVFEASALNGAQQAALMQSFTMIVCCAARKSW